MSQLKDVEKAARALRMTAIVDDDFPEMMHNLDTALHCIGKLPVMPKIVCLCGSCRFKDIFIEQYAAETDVGNIVLSVGRFMPQTEQDMKKELKISLDELHKRKIDLCDEVFVLNVGGYIGDSTRSEIAYAKATFKPIRYLEPIKN